MKAIGPTLLFYFLVLPSMAANQFICKLETKAEIYINIESNTVKTDINDRGNRKGSIIIRKTNEDNWQMLAIKEGAKLNNVTLCDDVTFTNNIFTCHFEVEVNGKRPAKFTIDSMSGRFVAQIDLHVPEEITYVHMDVASGQCVIE